LIDALGQFRGIDGDFARLRVPRHALVVGLHIGDVRGTTVLVLENAVVLEQVGCGDGHGASAIDIELVITGFGVTEVVLRDRDLALVILVDTDDARLVGVRQIREQPVLLGIGHTLPDSGGGPAVVVVDDEDFAILGVEVVVRGVAGLDTVIEDSAVIVGVVEVALEVDPVDELLDVDIAGIRCRVVAAIVSVVTIIATAVASTAVVVVAAIVSAAVVTVIAAVTGVVPVAAVIAPVAGVVGVSAVVVVSGVIPVAVIAWLVSVAGAAVVAVVASVVTGSVDVAVSAVSAAAAVLVILRVGNILAVGFGAGILVLGLVSVGRFRVAGRLGRIVAGGKGRSRGLVRVRT